MSNILVIRNFDSDVFARAEHLIHSRLVNRVICYLDYFKSTHTDTLLKRIDSINASLEFQRAHADTIWIINKANKERCQWDIAAGKSVNTRERLLLNVYNNLVHTAEHSASFAKRIDQLLVTSLNDSLVFLHVIPSESALKKADRTVSLLNEQVTNSCSEEYYAWERQMSGQTRFFDRVIICRKNMIISDIGEEIGSV